MSVVDNIERILKNEACKLDGVAVVLEDKGVASYLKRIAATLIDEANSISDLLCEKPSCVKDSPEPQTPTPSEGEDSTETMVEKRAENWAEYVDAYKPAAVISALSNGSAEQTE